MINVPRRISEFAIYDYLTYAYLPAPNTVFENVKKLPAAHYLLFKPGGPVKPKRNWNPIISSPKLNLSEEEIVYEIRERLYDSTSLRMTTDVELGLLLSGGLDSSISLACMSKFSHSPVKTFTTGFDNTNNYKNEFGYAK